MGTAWYKYSLTVKTDKPKKLLKIMCSVFTVRLQFADASGESSYCLEIFKQLLGVRHSTTLLPQCGSNQLFCLCLCGDEGIDTVIGNIYSHICDEKINERNMKKQITTSSACHLRMLVQQEMERKVDSLKKNSC